MIVKWDIFLTNINNYLATLPITTLTCDASCGSGSDKFNSNICLRVTFSSSEMPLENKLKFTLILLLRISF